MSRTVQKRGREAMTSRPEQQAGPRGHQTETTATRSRRSQAQENGEVIRDAEQRDRRRCLGRGAGITSQPLRPREAVMCPLRPRKDRRLRAGRESRRKGHLNPLVSHELHTGTSVLSATPILPVQRRGTDPEGMQEKTDPTRLCRGLSMPLTLRTLWAVAAIADPSAGEDAQTAIRFPALLGGTQRLAFWTVQHAVGLEGEIVPREAPSLPRQSNGRRAVALHRWLLGSGLWRFCHGRGKLGGAQRLWLELMAQFESEVPGPLRHDVPGFLPPGRVRAPAVRVLLSVFIS